MGKGRAKPPQAMVGSGEGWGPLSNAPWVFLSGITVSLAGVQGKVVAARKEDTSQDKASPEGSSRGKPSQDAPNSGPLSTLGPVPL